MPWHHGVKIRIEWDSKIKESDTIEHEPETWEVGVWMLEYNLVADYFKGINNKRHGTRLLVKPPKPQTGDEPEIDQPQAPAPREPLLPPLKYDVARIRLGLQDVIFCDPDLCEQTIDFPPPLKPSGASLKRTHEQMQEEDEVSRGQVSFQEGETAPTYLAHRYRRFHETLREQYIRMDIYTACHDVLVEQPKAAAIEAAKVASAALEGVTVEPEPFKFPTSFQEITEEQWLRISASAFLLGKKHNQGLPVGVRTRLEWGRWRDDEVTDRVEDMLFNHPDERWSQDKRYLEHGWESIVTHHVRNFLVLTEEQCLVDRACRQRHPYYTTPYVKNGKGNYPSQRRVPYAFGGVDFAWPGAVETKRRGRIADYRVSNFLSALLPLPSSYTLWSIPPDAHYREREASSRILRTLATSFRGSANSLDCFRRCGNG